MIEQQRSPYRPPKQARMMRLVNLPMRFALRLPFPTPLNKQLMLLSFTGRKSGKAYLQPVSYIPDDRTLLTPGGGKWKLNLQADHPITIWLRGHRVQARPEFVRDVTEVERLLMKMAAANPRVTSFVPVVGPDGAIDRNKLAVAVEHGFCIVRWHLPQTADTSNAEALPVSSLRP